MNIGLILSTIETVLTVAVLVSVGFVGVKTKVLGDSTLKELSSYLIYVAVPCTIIAKLYVLGSIKEALYGVLITSVSQIICIAIGYGLGLLAKIPEEKIGVYASSFGICNSGFIGLPIVTMLFGSEARNIAIYFLIANNVVFWTAGAFLIKRDAKKLGTLKKSSGNKNINPPILIFCVMLAIKAVGLPLPDFFISAVEVIDETTSPAALFFCGTVLGGIGFRNIKWKKGFSLIMFGRYVVSPLVTAGLFLLFPGGDLLEKVIIIQSAMPVVTLVEVGAKKYGGDVEYASLSFIYSLFFLMITLPVIYYILMTV